MREVGGGLYKPKPMSLPPASLHNIGTSLKWQPMTHRRREKSEVIRNNEPHVSTHETLSAAWYTKPVDPQV